MRPLPDKVSTQLDALLEAFRSGNVEAGIAKAALIAQHPDDDQRPIDNWSLCNRLLAWVGGTGDARGYRQWQQVGRQVRQGAKAIYILAPCTQTVSDTDDDGRETEETVLVGFRAVPVFRLEDTDGAPLPTYNYAPPEPPPLAGVAEALGVKVEYRPGPGFAYGQCDRDGTRIALFTHDARTFWHELAHAAHARVDGKLKGGQHAEQEAVAELSAAVLARLYGAPNDGGSYEYLRRCDSDSDPYRLALRVLATVEKVLALILDAASDEGRIAA